MTSYKFQPKIFPSIMTLAMLAILLSLGVWQMQRAAWKHDLIENYKKQSALEAVTELPKAEAVKDYIARRATLGGKFLHEKSIQLKPRVVNGTQGYDLVTPLKLYTGELIFVLRGFVPSETKDAVDQPTGTVAVSGYLKALPHKGWQAENNPDKDDWYWLDADAVSAKFKLEKPYPLLLAAEDKPNNTKWPQPHDVTPNINDNHMAYAATWFALAFILVLIYFRSAMKKSI